MRLTKKYFPSLGFVVLSIVIILTINYISWVISPPLYQKAMSLETKAHKFTKEGNYKEAANYFLQAAKIKDDAISTSRRYRCVGTVSSDIQEKIKYYKLALKYDPKNQNAINSLKGLQGE